MAEPIQYTPKPPKIGPDAHDELERLLQTMHEHGVLRFANDLVAANTQWTQIIVEGLSKEGSRRTVQNLSVLLMVLSRIEPGDFYKMVFALRDSLEYLARCEPGNDQPQAPGLKGTYRMLKDDALWRGLTPLLGALKTFGKGLEREVEKPISAFTGKPTER
ncbi:MAG TPA: DUF1641 domain-containing protein [Rhodanobacteraceae bacterium]|jgi:uncharacterized protein YjgD (DUF1641 family)|nr:DUF1641 domain-containing protein [Rhodanobacteraceae bacterium]